MFLVLFLLVSPGVRLLTPEAAQYEKVELELPSPAVPDNPFDPGQSAVDGAVTLPSGRILRVPGFWYQAYKRSIANPAATGNERIEELTPVGEPVWRIRFSSPESGPHKVSVWSRINGRRGQAPAVTVMVRPGRKAGFLRRSPGNAGYLEHENGKPFFAIGQNLCMYENREGTYYYDRILPKLAANKVNYVRLWQEYYVPQDITLVASPGSGSFAGFPLETQATGLGRYDLASAWRLDHVVSECERHEIYFQIAFEMTVWWQTRLRHRWPRNPYNAANGGPCATPGDFFTSPVARELVRRRLRYSIARWGWSTHLAAWELWNEVDNNDGFDAQANESWHREMAGYLKSADPWKHLITTSWRNGRMFALADIDIVQGHSYWDSCYDAAQYSLQDTEHLMRRYGKPFFFGEQGVEDPSAAVRNDPDGRHFHDTIWATAMSGAAGTGLYWWWHNYLEPLNLYYHYKALASFLEGENMAARHWSPAGLSRPNLPVSLQLYGLAAPDRALLWIHDPLAFRIVDGKPESGPSQRNASLNVTGLADGEYVIAWWDTIHGRIVRQDGGRVRASDHFGYGLELLPPPFWGDIAARVTRKDKR